MDSTLHVGPHRTSVTLRAYPAHVLRASISGPDAAAIKRAAVDLAERLERASGMAGSAVVYGSGRWHGKSEHGATVTISVHAGPEHASARKVRRALAEFRVASGLTVYVLTTRADALEVY